MTQAPLLLRALKELLELVEISEMENNDLPPHEYEAIHDDAINQAKRAIKLAMGD